MERDLHEDLESFSETILDRVSSNVTYYRKQRGYTQMQLALEIGMSGGAYLGRAEIRKNGHHFNLKHLAKIAKVLDVDIREFFVENEYL
ncbi:MAG: helix-turn-helix domain-containing protein [Sulfurimonadaceae bacterium]